MFVTARSEVDLRDEVADAIRSLGLTVESSPALVVDGAPLSVVLVERAHPNPAEVAALVKQGPPSVLVADRISEAGRELLREAGWGWLDRRGHLRIWQPGIRLEVALAGVEAPPPRATNVWTAVGLEVALWALINPTEEVRARRVAAELGRSVGATHELIARFSHLGLVGPSTHRPLLPDLFWETSARWPDDGWTALPATIEEVAARVGTGQLVRVDERAATLGGARIAAAGDLPARCYVDSNTALRRARGLAGQGAPRCFVRLSPVRWIPELAGHPPTERHPWRIAHPILCALRLAADPARGREIVESWGVIPEGSAA